MNLGGSMACGAAATNLLLAPRPLSLFEGLAPAPFSPPFPEPKPASFLLKKEKKKKLKIRSLLR